EKEIYVEIAGEVIRPGVYLVAESTSVKELIYKAGGVTVNCDLSRINWDLVLVLGARIYIPSFEDADEVLDDSSLININKANLETLITLPGIGDILGQRIIDYRAEFGEFLTIEEIMNVSGIKESVYAQIKELITV
ncbi:MAG TPA: ComEA family DNA-binding protein, partial [Bacillota bacterium]|nr:ComEA family DNA-binding protein [Bacillota bacterium]